MSRLRLIALLAVGMVLAAAADAACAYDRARAVTEYRISCAGCHGPRGKGNGPAASSLSKKPTDLTLLEQNNDYEFPMLKVFQTIDGRAMIPEHGTREMPVWGRRYVDDIGETYGPYGGEAAVRARVLELVEYVRSLQER